MQRGEWTGQTGKGGFRPRRNLKKVKDMANAMLYSENIAFDWAGGS